MLRLLFTSRLEVQAVVGAVRHPRPCVIAISMHRHRVYVRMLPDHDACVAACIAAHVHSPQRQGSYSMRSASLKLSKMNIRSHPLARISSAVHKARDDYSLRRFFADPSFPELSRVPPAASEQQAAGQLPFVNLQSAIYVHICIYHAAAVPHVHHN